MRYLLHGRNKYHIYTLALTLLLLLLFFKAHQHKDAGMRIKLRKNNDHDGILHGVKCSQEGDRIAALESNGQSLQQEHRLFCVLCGCSDASTNFLDQLNGGLVPGTSSLKFSTATGKIIIITYYAKQRQQTCRYNILLTKL